MAKSILKLLDSTVTFIVTVILCIMGAYAIYALWDNNQIYSAAKDIQADLLQYKPAVDADGGATFEELLAINPDVCAWISVDNTNIDYPVVQGENILSYINTDVYGNFALAGSIFLDTQCDNTFHDAYSLIYGHHMENSQMFGDLELFEEQEFFDENQSGMLILPDRSYELEIFACLVVSASEDMIFDPTKWQTETDELLDFAKENAVCIRQKTVDEMQAEGEESQILAMSTCSSDFTDARTILLAKMIPYTSANEA